MTSLDPWSIVINLLIFGGLIFINAIFVAIEFAFVRIRKTRILELKEQGNRKADLVLELMDDLDKVVSTSQLGITVASLALGAISEAFFTEVFIELFDLMNLPLDPVIYHIFSFIVSLLLITGTHVIVGEQMPKIYAIVEPEKVAMSLAKVIKVSSWLTNRVLVKPMINASYFLMKLPPFNIKEPPSETVTQGYSEDEIKMIIKDAIKKGELEEFESDLIFNIFKFTDTTVKSVKTPRFKVVSIKKGCTVKEIIETSIRTGFSRFPVYEGRLDNIVGSIHIKDVITTLEGDDSIKSLDKPFDFEKHMRKTLIVHEGKPIDDLLKEMQEEKVQMAVVVDEYGVFEGIITIEDIIEKIFGPIDDEFDPVTQTIEKDLKNGQRKFTIDAQKTLDEFNKEFASLGVKLESKDAITIAGYLLEILESEIPEPGTIVQNGNLKFKIINVKSNRIDNVELEIMN